MKSTRKRWTLAEDKLLIELSKIYGNNFSEFVNLFNQRSIRSLKYRHNRLASTNSLPDAETKNKKACNTKEIPQSKRMRHSGHDSKHKSSTSHHDVLPNLSVQQITKASSDSIHVDELLKDRQRQCGTQGPMHTYQRDKEAVYTWMLEYLVKQKEITKESQRAELLRDCIRGILRNESVNQVMPSKLRKSHSHDSLRIGKLLRLITLHRIVSKPQPSQLLVALDLLSDWPEVQDFDIICQDIARETVLSSLRHCCNTPEVNFESTIEILRNLRPVLKKDSLNDFGMILRVAIRKTKDVSRAIIKRFVKRQPSENQSLKRVRKWVADLHEAQLHDQSFLDRVQCAVAGTKPRVEKCVSSETQKHDTAFAKDYLEGKSKSCDIGLINKPKNATNNSKSNPNRLFADDRFIRPQALMASQRIC